MTKDILSSNEILESLAFLKMKNLEAISVQLLVRQYS